VEGQRRHLFAREELYAAFAALHIMQDVEMHYMIHCIGCWKVFIIINTYLSSYNDSSSKYNTRYSMSECITSHILIYDMACQNALHRTLYYII